MATVIAYVDGFNLYHGLHDKYHRRYLWLDLERLVQRQYLSSNKNPNGYCGLGGTGVSCPVGVARADG